MSDTSRLLTFQEVQANESTAISNRRATLSPTDQANVQKPTPPSKGSAEAASSAAENPLNDLVGLALSGGGIRSATFNLGIIQGLAKSGLLRSFDYVSTVSGGGFIGSWLSAWLIRQSLGQVDSQLRQTSSRPVQHLREYTNYLAPRVALLSADSWTLIAIYLRNLFLNLLVLIPGAILLLLVPRGFIELYAFLASHGILIAWSGAVSLVLLLISFFWIAQSLALIDSSKTKEPNPDAPPKDAPSPKADHVPRPESAQESGSPPEPKAPNPEAKPQHETKPEHETKPDAKDATTSSAQNAPVPTPPNNVRQPDRWRYWVHPLLMFLMAASVLLCFTLSEDLRYRQGIAIAQATAGHLTQLRRQEAEQTQIIDKLRTVADEKDESVVLRVPKEQKAKYEDALKVLAAAPGDLSPFAVSLSPAPHEPLLFQQTVGATIPTAGASTPKPIGQSAAANKLAATVAMIGSAAEPAPEHPDESKISIPLDRQVLSALRQYSVRAERQRTQLIAVTNRLESQQMQFQVAAINAEAVLDSVKSLSAYLPRSINLAFMDLRPTRAEVAMIYPDLPGTDRTFPWTLAKRYMICFGIVHLLAHIIGYSPLLRRSNEYKRASHRFLRFLGLIGCAGISGVLGGLLLVVLYVYGLSDFVHQPYAMLTWAPPAMVLSFMVAAYIEIGLTSKFLDEQTREWWARVCAWLSIYAACWTLLFATALYSPLLVRIFSWTVNLAGVGAWLATTIGGLLAGKSPKTDGAKSSGNQVRPQTVGDHLRNLLTAVAPAVFVAGLLILLACQVHRWSAATEPLPTNSNYADFPQEINSPAITVSMTRTQKLRANSDDTLVQQQVTEQKRPAMPLATLMKNYWFSLMNADGWVLIWIAGGSLLTLAAFALIVDVNKFSLNALYANRLVRCYLGASVSERHPHLFTGFDPNDDLLLAKLNGPVDPPLHIVNTTLNLVHGENLAWQERKASSFVLTAIACGSHETGYRLTDEFAGGKLTLGKAVAISGAAASPNAGYHSSPALTALMTIFNVRLGWWMPNPQKGAWKAQGPRVGLMYLLVELFGLTDSNSAFVYLSDGGHFDNLGVYELVRRRCRYIVVSDAGADPDRQFWDLGGLIRKCRIDFDVEISMNSGYEDLFRVDSTTCRSQGAWRCGTIHYPDRAWTGTLIYVKPSVRGKEPADVLNYACEHKQFPHEPTTDQFFSESQFESYRSLGLHIAQELFDSSASPAASIGQCFDAIAKKDSELKSRSAATS